MERKKKKWVTDREKGTEEEREQAEQTPRDGDDSKSRFHHLLSFVHSRLLLACTDHATKCFSSLSCYSQLVIPNMLHVSTPFMSMNEKMYSPNYVRIKLLQVYLYL